MTARFEKSIYPKEALLKAAYGFIDKHYVHIETEEDYYCISITSKSGSLDDRIAAEFENELLSQTIRYCVSEKTRKIREIILARAMASTIIEDENEIVIEESSKYDNQIDDIAKDWFENEESDINRH